MALDFAAGHVVVEIAGERLVVDGRAAAMVVYLAQNGQRVNVAEKGHVAFDFYAEQISPRIHAIDGAISLK